jgi:hypothetical protein
LETASAYSPTESGDANADGCHQVEIVMGNLRFKGCIIADERPPQSSSSSPWDDTWLAPLWRVLAACEAMMPAQLQEFGPRSRDRLRQRLEFYGVEERSVWSDGNCQFASASDQLFGSPSRHAEVRAAAVAQLRKEPERYSPFVAGWDFNDYTNSMSRHREWGDNVTLQAIADAYGVHTVLVTSFPQACIIEIQPLKVKSEKVVWLSFWAELHYSSLYPKGAVPQPEHVADPLSLAAGGCSIC